MSVSGERNIMNPTPTGSVFVFVFVCVSCVCVCVSTREARRLLKFVVASLWGCAASLQACLPACGEDICVWEFAVQGERLRETFQRAVPYSQ